VRLFVAIEFPKDVSAKAIERISALAQVLKDPYGALRWVGREQLHVTLKFLGETREDKVSSLKSAIQDAASKHHPFSLELGGVGGFGGQDGYRVIWLGIGEGSEKAGKLTDSIEAACELLGVPRENRRFHPHVTLARCKTGSCRVDMKSLKPELTQTPVAVFPVDHIALIQSTLTPSGSKYDVLERFPLSLS
jgi:2'-5' RNA ligase